MLEASQQYRQENSDWIRERDRLRMRLQRGHIADKSEPTH
jgi:hypothetical protein